MKQLDDRAMDEVARYFGALAVTMRLKILNQLRGGEMNVGDLARETGCTQANVSKHLAMLAANGFVRRETRGTSTYYRIADPAIYRLCDLVCDRIADRYAAQAPVQEAFAPTARKRAVRRG